MATVFLCHSSADKEFVRRLANDLNSRHLSVWVDEREILVGDRIREKIEQGLKASDFLAVVLSPEAMSSQWVQRELDAKFLDEIETKRVTILPLYLRDCDIPALLKGKRYADFRASYESGLAELVARFSQGNREEEAKKQVLARLAARSSAVDSHALIELAINAREFDAAETLISAHEASHIGCSGILVYRAMMSHTRFMSEKTPDRFIAAVTTVYEMTCLNPARQNIANFHELCKTPPKDPRCARQLLSTLDDCLKNQRPKKPALAVALASALLVGLNKLEMTQEQKTSACETCCGLLETSSKEELRNHVGSLLNVATHIANGMSDSTAKQKILGRAHNSAVPKVGDAQEYADAFLHLAWACALQDRASEARDWLGKYRMSTPAATYDQRVRSHQPLDMIAAK